MNFDNIQMAVVTRKDINSRINISQINESNRDSGYECIICGSKVIPVVPEGKTTDGKDSKITPHFKHLNADKCKSESWYHFWIKTELIKIGTKFKVVTDKVNEYTCNQIFFEQPIIIGDKKYIPDATIHTSCGEIIHFEFNYSNSKKIKDYIEKWTELNQTIVEFNFNDLLCVCLDTVPTFNALYYSGKLFHITNEEKDYYELIGKYKITKNDKEVLLVREIELEKLDWLWDEIRKIKYENKGYKEIGDLLRSISKEETKQIVINILKKGSHSNILRNYISFLKDKIDKRLKLLNLKHNGILINHKINIPHRVYDRIFSGIEVEFFILNGYPFETISTFSYDFNKDILSNKLKDRIDDKVNELKECQDKLLNTLDILKSKGKIIEFKYHYKDSIDYIDSILFTDYRNNKYVLSDSCYNNNNNNKYYAEIFNLNEDCITDVIYIWSTNNILVETQTSYEHNQRYYIKLKYEFENIFDQKEINFSYKFLNSSWKYLYDFNFVEITEELKSILVEICDFESYKRKEICEFIHYTSLNITDQDINNKIKKALNKIINISNSNNKSLNIILNSRFTKDKNGRNRLWLVKEFIEVLEEFKELGITNIDNIK